MSRCVVQTELAMLVAVTGDVVGCGNVGVGAGSWRIQTRWKRPLADAVEKVAVERELFENAGTSSTGSGDGDGGGGDVGVGVGGGGREDGSVISLPIVSPIPGS